MLKGTPVPKMEQGRSVDLVGQDFKVARGYVTACVAVEALPFYEAEAKGRQGARTDISPLMDTSGRADFFVGKVMKKKLKKAKEKQSLGGKEKVRQNSAKPIKVKEEIAKIAGVSHDTVSRVKFIEKKADNLRRRHLTFDFPELSKVKPFL